MCGGYVEGVDFGVGVFIFMFGDLVSGNFVFFVGIVGSSNLVF